MKTASPASAWSRFRACLPLVAALALVACHGSEPPVATRPDAAAVPVKQADDPARTPEAPAAATPPAAAPTDPDAEAAEFRRACLAAAEQLTADLPQQAEAWDLLALVQNRFGDRESAVDAWRLALHINPRLASAHFGVGQARLDAGEARLAAAAFRLAIQAEPEMREAHLALGEALLAAGQFDEALAAMKSAVQRFPDEARAYFHLGQTHLQLGQLAEARAALEKSVKLDPAAAYPHYALATVCTRLGDAEAAAQQRALFRQLKEADQTVEKERLRVRDDLASVCQTAAFFRAAAGMVYAQAGKVDRALACWREAAAIDPRDRPSREQLGEWAMRQGDHAEAARWFAELVRLDPAHAPYSVCLGMARAELGQVDEAEAAFQAAIANAPDQAAGYLALAQLHLRANHQLAAARALVTTATEKEPSGPSFALLATVCERLGDVPAARAAIARALELEPARPEFQAIADRLGKESP